MRASLEKKTRSGCHRNGSKSNTKENHLMSEQQGTAPPPVRDYVTEWARIERTTAGDKRWAVAGAIGHANSTARSTGAAEPNDAWSAAWCELAVTAFEEITGGAR